MYSLLLLEYFNVSFRNILYMQLKYLSPLNLSLLFSSRYIVKIYKYKGNFINFAPDIFFQFIRFSFYSSEISLGLLFTRMVQIQLENNSTSFRRCALTHIKLRDVCLKTFSIHFRTL